MNKVGHRYKLWGSGKVWGPGLDLLTIVAACPLRDQDSPMEDNRIYTGTAAACASHRLAAIFLTAELAQA